MPIVIFLIRAAAGAVVHQLARLYFDLFVRPKTAAA